MKIIDINSKSKPRVSRRDFLKLLKLSGLGIVAAAGGAYFLQDESNWLQVKQIRLVLPRLPASFSGIRIAQVSDIHMGGWMNIERLRQVFGVVNELVPNIVAITGDFVFNRGWESTDGFEMLEMEAELKLIAAQYTTLAVLGNHDYWTDADASMVTAVLERSGVRALVNAVQKIQIGKEFLYFAGVDDVMEGRANIDKVLLDLPENSCAILMAHEPDFADESAETGRFDLQISGHSHGGQVDLPFIGAPVLPLWAHKYSRGLYQVRNMYQYTNVGVGMTPPYIRFNCRPEITVFTLESM